mmetsp:Transcript_26677/g.61445  ORF Transcript_26677/g.61445 Transcript_26677/m.61445 type:complete len:231 (+) Transcript_26677:496-1188(+)
MRRLRLMAEGQNGLVDGAARDETAVSDSDSGTAVSDSDSGNALLRHLLAVCCRGLVRRRLRVGLRLRLRRPSALLELLLLLLLMVVCLSLLEELLVVMHLLHVPGGAGWRRPVPGHGGHVRLGQHHTHAQRCTEAAELTAVSLAVVDILAALTPARERGHVPHRHSHAVGHPVGDHMWQHAATALIVVVAAVLKVGCHPLWEPEPAGSSDEPGARRVGRGKTHGALSHGR